MPQRFFCDLNVSFYSNIQMAITMRELALLQAEVLNAASLALAVLALSETGLAEQARAVGCGERCRPTHTHTTTTTSPTRSDHSPPFLAYPALGNITFICTVSNRPRHPTLHATLLLMLCIDLAARGRRRATNEPV